MLTKEELTRAIEVAEFELMKMTHETLRKSQGYKIRTHGVAIAALTTCINYYKAELEKLPKAAPKRKED